MSSLPKSLQDDNLLTGHLKGHLNYVCNQVGQVDDRVSALINETADFHSRLQRVQNTLSALKDKRYVQELIIEEEEEDNKYHKQDETSIRNVDADLRTSISQATTQGLEMISRTFKPIAVRIPNQILTDNLIPNDIYEAIDEHLLRDLPPIIGSSSFRSWNVADIVDRPVETSEITIGTTPVQTQKVKPTTPIPPQVNEQALKPLIIPTPPEPSPPKLDDIPKSNLPQPSNDLLAQLSERLGVETKARAVDNVSQKSDEHPIPKRRTSSPIKEPPKILPKVSPKPKPNLIEESSSSEEELFANKPVEAKPQPIKTETPIKVERVTKKPAVKKPLLGESDDSFDELFKKAPNIPTVSKPIDAMAKKPVTAKVIAKPVDRVKRAERKKRSIFDTSSSSSEDEQQQVPSKQQTTTKQPEFDKSSDDEDMPKSVLNSVSNDFSSRLNQALLKKPSPSPSSSVTLKSEEKPEEKPSTTISSKSTKKEPVEYRKQETVSALRGKLGDSIAKAHRVSADSLDIKKASLGKDSSSSDETESREPNKVDDTNTLIQTLKARPKPPARNHPQRQRPPVAQPVKKVDNEKVETQKPKVVEENNEKIKSTVVKEKPEVKKPTTKKKGLFDSSDSDDPF